MVTTKDGQSTIPGWRDIERAFAAIFDGNAPEGKQVFDVLVQSTTTPGAVYGFSVKSKSMTQTVMSRLGTSSRVYMELSNSSAKFWDVLRSHGITEANFTAKQDAQRIGEKIISVVEGWHCEDAIRYSGENPGLHIDLKKSVYLTVSYNKATATRQSVYQFHSFGLRFPIGIIWQYSSDCCLRGMDPAHPTEALFDWYGLSGGQLKYYPRATNARYTSSQFTLETPQLLPVTVRAARYWPQKWLAAGGSLTLSREELISELDKMIHAVRDTPSQQILERALASVRTAGR